MANEVSTNVKGGALVAPPASPAIFATSIDMSQPEGRIKAINAMGNCDMVGSDVAGAGEVRIVDFLLHHNTARTEDGEMVEYPRMVLWLDTGESVSFSSVYVTKAVWSYHQLIQAGPWNPPLRMRIEVAKRGGKSPYIATIIGQS